MLPVILLILKVIGILLLCILGLVLLFLLLILFVPIRYKGKGSFYERPEGRITISWLLHIISVTVSFSGQADVAVRLFGFRLFNKAPKASAKERDERGTIDEAELSGDEAPNFEEEPILSIQEAGHSDTPQADPKALPQFKDSGSGYTHTQDEPGSGKKNLFLRLADRFRSVICRLKLAFKRLCESIKKFNHTKEEITVFISDEKNRETFRLLVKQAKKLARHIFPGKLKGRIAFGLEDPYTMGQILSGAALFYPLYHRQFLVEPVFDRRMIEGEAAFKGRIRLCVFLIAGLKILLNKNFRVQLKRVLNRGGI